MGYIEPSSVIQFFKGINLDNRYLHTIYFANESTQNSWFTGKVNLTIQRHSYQRYGVGQIKVQGDATDFLEYTYMRFKNDRSVDMWFYAFITLVEYVNENTVLITYEIDVMQTWFIQKGSIRPCMVMREHVNDDVFGAHLEEEPVGSESYECDFLAKSDNFETYDVVMVTSEDASITNSDVQYLESLGMRIKAYNNDLFAPCITLHTTISEETGAQNLITALTTLLGGSWESGQRKYDLVDFFTFPTDFCSWNKNENTHALEVTNPFSYGSYTPKNKKLLTYPFNYLYGTTMDGENAIFRWEYFDGLYVTSPTVIFHLYGSPIGGGMITCYPDLYDGIDDNHDVALNMSNFPKNPFTIDSYQAWVASGGKTRLERAETFTNIRGMTALASGSSASLASMTSGTNMIGQSVVGMHNYSQGDYSVPLSARTASASSGAHGIIGGVANFVNTALDVAEAKSKINYQWADAKYRPNVVKGTSTPNLTVPMRSLNFNFYNVHIRENEARHIDDFFSCYGYAINKVKAPNLTGRQYWNFVQTKGAVIAGNMPSSSKEAIARIFDGGITFWHNGDNVGNYALSTSNGSINNPIV